MAASVGGCIAKAGHTVEVISRDPAKSRDLANNSGPSDHRDVRLQASRRHRHPCRAVLHCCEGGVQVRWRPRRQSDYRHHEPDLSRSHWPRRSEGSSGAQEIAKGVPVSAHVVKAFNTLFGAVLAKGSRLDAFFATDDAAAKARVSKLLESLGLHPLYVGGLPMARTLEAVGLMMIGLAKNGAGSWDIALNLRIG